MATVPSRFPFPIFKCRGQRSFLQTLLNDGTNDALQSSLRGFIYNTRTLRLSSQNLSQHPPVKMSSNESHSQCLQNPPTLDSACGSGIVDEIAGLKTYVSGAANSNRAIVLISDVFGYEAPILRRLADKVATKGFLVVVPDFLYGDPVNFEKPGFDIKAWLEIHGADKGCEDAKAVISALRSQGISYVGVAGFCWGGQVAAKLAKSDSIQAAVSLHPGPISTEDINEIKAPIAFLGAEVDHLCSAEELLRFGEILSAKPGIDSYVKIYPGVSHGFAVRYSLEDESAVKSAEEAQADMMSWLMKYVK